MDNRAKTRMAVAAAAIVAVLLLVGIFWLLSSNDGWKQPQVADSGDEAARRKQHAPAGDPVGINADDTIKKTDAPAADKPAEPAKKPDTGVVRPEGEVQPDKAEPVPGEVPERKPKVDGEVEPDSPDGEEGSRPDPEKPITVDFVNRDVQTVMHYIALRSGLNVILQGSLDTKVTVMLRDTKPREAIRTICAGNNLELVEDSGSFIIRKNPAASAAVNVTRGSSDGLWNISLEKQPIASAILEFARNATVTVFLPSTSTDSDKQVSTLIRNATVEVIMNHLAALAGWTATKGEGEDPTWTFSRK